MSATAVPIWQHPLARQRAAAELELRRRAKERDASARPLTFAVVPAELDDRGRLRPMYEYEEAANRLLVRLHAGQRRAWDAAERWVLMLAGTQGGKTSFAPVWLLREIVSVGMGDYLFVAPTFRLLDLKALPEFKRLFVDTLRLGKLTEGNAPRFVLSRDGERRLFGRTRGEDDVETRVLFGHAQDPDSLESATAKGAVLDEAGQKKFKKGSFEAIERRLSLAEGRGLLPTTPYTLGWLKDKHDKAGAPGSAKAQASDTALVQFESVDNPAFPRAEYERQRAAKPAWKFNMMYRGRFERPAGLIYDVFSKAVHVTPAFPVPAGWPRFDGFDFGAVNTAGIEVRREPGTNRYVAVRAYHAGSRTAAEHAAAVLKPLRPGEPAEPLPVRAWGGAPSEDNWRREFGAAGLPIAKPPVSDVEVGIDRVYALLKNHPARVRDFSRDDETPYNPDLPYLELMEGAPGVAELVSDLETYARELNDDDEPTEKIEDKETWHRLDALRYLAAGIATPPAAPRRRSRVSQPLSYVPR